MHSCRSIPLVELKPLNAPKTTTRADLGLCSLIKYGSTLDEHCKTAPYFVFCNSILLQVLPRDEFLVKHPTPANEIAFLVSGRG